MGWQCTVSPGNPSHWLSAWTRGAGTGGLGLAVEGPSEAKMSCMDNKDGSCLVEYIPYEAGTYSLNITYGGHQVPGEGARWRSHTCGPCSSPGTCTQLLPLCPFPRQSFQGPCA